jgi:cytidylate kinase
LRKSVVISGPPAVGKTTVALALAKEFDLVYLSGGDILKEMAKEEGFSGGGQDWWDKTGGMEFLKMRQKNLDFDRKVDQKLLELFKRGNSVITSYTIPWLIQDNNIGIKIWLSGSHQNSASRMHTRDNISIQEALEITKKRYTENTALYKKLYGFEFGKDLSIFDKLINTNEMSMQQVIDIAVDTVRKLL